MNWTYKLKNAGNGFMIREPDPEFEYRNLADVFMTNAPEIAESRACLMAAAPELLEACRVGLESLRAFNEISMMRLPKEQREIGVKAYEQSPEIKRLVAAIAKAEIRAVAPKKAK